MLLFQDALTFWKTLHYIIGGKMWHYKVKCLFQGLGVVVEVVIKVLLPIMIGFVLNQSREHWLLGKALQFIIVACRDFKSKLGKLGYS